MFKIEITESKPVNRVVKGEWVLLETHSDKSQYGYAPEIEKTVQESRVVLIQSVETIDLDKVIRAINRLE